MKRAIVNKKVRTRLHSLRLEAGLSQNRLARFADLDRKTVSDVENGRNSPQEVTFAKLAKALSQALGREISAEEIET